MFQKEGSASPQRSCGTERGEREPTKARVLGGRAPRRGWKAGGAS